MGVQWKRRRNAKPVQLAPEDLLAKDATLQGKPIGKMYAVATKLSMERVEKQWNRYCEFMKKDSLECLRQCSAEQKTGQQPDDYVGKEVADYIDGPLREEHDLDLSVHPFPRSRFSLANIDDLLVILHYQWAFDTATFPHERQRAQLSLLLLMIAYTSSRPGALIESESLRGSNEALCYKNVRVLVIKNPYEPDYNMIVMEVTSRYGKEESRNLSTTYLFHERDDNLAICPILQFLALAFADNAFEAEVINSLEDIFRLNVKAPRNSLQLKWKHSWQDTPIFRHAVCTLDGIRISSDKALQYSTIPLPNTYGDLDSPPALVRYSPLTVLDEELLMQSTMSRQLRSVIRYQDILDRISFYVTTSQSAKMKNVEGTDIYHRYSQLCRNLASKRQFLRSSKLVDIGREFFSTIDTIEIERQLSGQLTLHLANDLAS
ncbi:MAG: hypothetical protein M1839_004778 [Geoglossum umbratile]|nr:MAG: hypothetical protein M1839_004778 [Geoglossum umbratile]